MSTRQHQIMCQNMNFIRRLANVIEQNRGKRLSIDDLYRLAKESK